MRYFLAPMSGEKSYQNYLSTIKQGVPFERIKPFLSEEGRSILSKEEVIYAWANREGKKKQWEKMQTGDTVLFYANRNFIIAATVIHKQYSPDLALAMWPRDEHGQPWSYTFFVNNLRYIKIPLAYFNLISGYKIPALMGFQEVSPEHTNKIFEHYKNFDELIKSFTEEKNNIVERKYINVSNSVIPLLHEAKITAYQPIVKEVDASRKKKGYVDFSEINEKNSKTGDKGEEVVLKYERDLLISLGRPDLASKVKRISLEDTYAGYDILSFDITGKEKHIEVKTTIGKLGNQFSFVISRNEQHVSESSTNYFIYLVFEANTTSPKIHIIKNPFARRDLFSIEPIKFIIRGNFDSK